MPSESEKKIAFLKLNSHGLVFDFNKILKKLLLNCFYNLNSTPPPKKKNLWPCGVQLSPQNPYPLDDNNNKVHSISKSQCTLQ